MIGTLHVTFPDAVFGFSMDFIAWLFALPARNDDRSADMEDAEVFLGRRRVGSKYDDPITCSDCCVWLLPIVLPVGGKELSLGAWRVVLLEVPTQLSK